MSEMLLTSEVSSYWLCHTRGIVIRADKEIILSIKEQMGFCFKLGL